MQVILESWAGPKGGWTRPERFLREDAFSSVIAVSDAESFGGACGSGVSVC